MSTPYSKYFDCTVDDPATPQVFELRFPARGTLKFWAIKLLNGDATTAEVSIFTSEAAAIANDITQRVLNKSASVPWAEVVAVDYTNREGTPSNPVRKLWARIDPNGTGEQEFRLELTTHLPSYF